ncbi:hypothetical protein K2P97_00750 [bacterium]|nr:hypothetical protein [bacterium]
MTRSHFYTFLFILLPTFYYISLPITVGDLAGWTAYGQYALREFSILREDIYSVLSARPLVYPVLMPLVYGVIDLIGGLSLISLFHKLILALVLWIIYSNSLGKLRNPFNLKNLFFVLVFFSGITIYFIDRPALAVFINLVLSYLIIEQDEVVDWKDFAKLWLILVFWVNMHGSWPVMIVMLGWKFLFITNKSNLLKHTSQLAILCASSVLNPFGYLVWPYMFETAAISKERHIDEWNVTNFTDFYPQGYIFCISVCIVMFFVFRKIKTTKNYKMFSSPIFILILMGFAAIRNVGLFNFVLLPFLFKYGFLKDSEVTQKNSGFSNAINAVLAVLLILLCVSQTPYFKANFEKQYSHLMPAGKLEVFDDAAPVEFADYIQATNSTAPILNDWEYGSYLMYRLKNKILMDARNIIYYENDFNEYLKIMDADPLWPTYADKYKFDFILLNKHIRQALIAQIETNSLWKKVVENQHTVLFQRK